MNNVIRIIQFGRALMAKTASWIFVNSWQASARQVSPQDLAEAYQRWARRHAQCGLQDHGSDLECRP